MKLILFCILILQAVTAYYTWAGYQLDKEFTEELKQNEEQEKNNDKQNSPVIWG